MAWWLSISMKQIVTTRCWHQCPLLIYIYLYMHICVYTPLLLYIRVLSFKCLNSFLTYIKIIFWLFTHYQLFHVGIFSLTLPSSMILCHIFQKEYVSVLTVWNNFFFFINPFIWLTIMIFNFFLCFSSAFYYILFYDCFLLHFLFPYLFWQHDVISIAFISIRILFTIKNLQWFFLLLLYIGHLNCVILIKSKILRFYNSYHNKICTLMILNHYRLNKFNNGPQGIFCK